MSAGRYSSITGEGLDDRTEDDTQPIGIVVSRERTAELELETAVVRLQGAFRAAGLAGEVDAVAVAYMFIDAPSSASSIVSQNVTSGWRTQEPIGRNDVGSSTTPGATT